MFVGPVGWSHVLLVLRLEVGSLLNEEVYHIILVVLDGIIDWPFVLGIRDVKLRSIVNEELSHTNQTLSYTVVNGGLSVLILPIEISTFIYQ